MRTSVEQDAAGSIEVLTRAWGASETFALLPARSPVDHTQVQGILAGLPDRLRDGHYVPLTSGSTGQPKLVIGSRSRAGCLAAVIHDA